MNWTRLGNAPGDHNTEFILCQASYGADAVRALDEHGGPGALEALFRGISEQLWAAKQACEPAVATPLSPGAAWCPECGFIHAPTQACLLENT